MNIQQLETFYWITRLGTFAAAGEYLHTSQANVSSRIRELESELDVLLFERIGRTVTLTLKGRELLAHAERVVAEAARLRVAAEHESAEQAGAWLDRYRGGRRPGRRSGYEAGADRCDELRMGGRAGAARRSEQRAAPRSRDAPDHFAVARCAYLRCNAGLVLR